MNHRIFVNTVIIATLLATASKTFQGAGFLFYFAPVGLIILSFLGIKEGYQNKKFRILVLLLWAFGIWTFITAFWSIYPLVTLKRGAYFLLMSMGAVSGAFLWSRYNKNRLGFLLPLFFIVIITSIISLILNIPENSWTGGNEMGFMGFTIHQNTLASLIIFTLPSLIETILKKRKPQQRKHRYLSLKSYVLSLKTSILNFVLLPLSFVLALLTHSRASLLALGVMTLLIIIFFFNKKQMLITAASIIILITAVMLIQPSRAYVKNLVYKDSENVLDRRTPLWEGSYEAAKIGGWIGAGYGVSVPSIKVEAAGSHYEGERYRREKGNSQLAIVEEVGIIGTAIFILPIGFVMRKIIKILREHGCMNEWMHENHQIYMQSYNHTTIQSAPDVNKVHVIVLSSLVAFLIHSLFESWWVGPGGIHLFIFFMFLSTGIEELTERIRDREVIKI